MLGSPATGDTIGSPGSALGAAIERWATSATLKPTTLANYRRCLLAFARFVSAHGKRLDAIDRGFLRTWVGYERFAVTTILLRIAALRAFFRWLYLRGDLAVDPAARLVRPRWVGRGPTVLDIGDVGAVLEAPAAITVAGLRDRALLELLYATGIRALEMVAVDIDHLELDVHGDVVVHTEAREVALPLGRCAVRALAAYLARRHELRPACGALFIGPYGARLSVDAARACVRHHARLAIQRHDVSPRVLRTSCAVHLLARGADLSVVRLMLGHASVCSTMRYEGISMDQAVAVYERAHPLARRRCLA
jgi:site-specific recombinase XerD